MHPKITILKNGRLAIAAWDCPQVGKISKAVIDLTPHAGERVRIWLDEDGYSLDKYKNHLWQIAELDVPVQTFRDIDGPPDSEGRPTQTRELIPVDLADVEIIVFDIPA